MAKFLSVSFKVLLTCLFIGVTSVFYTIYHYSRDLPDYSQLKNYHPPSVTRIYSANGKLIEEYAEEHRVFVPIGNIPQLLVDAFVAAEDKNFFEHSGVDIGSIIRAAVANINNILHNKRIQGGSTITQQVVKNFLLTSERSLPRKIKEAILSYRVSQVYSKNQILELYLNQIFLGKGYGVAVAAQNYFNKSIDELNLAESAFLAALPKAPSTYNPKTHYDRAKERRDYVIMRMFEDGYITAEAAKEAISSAIILASRNPTDTLSADYYAENVREHVINMFGKEMFYTGGLTIITSLDSKMQKQAQASLRKGIRDYDRSKGYRGHFANIKIDNWLEDLKNVPTPQSLLEYKIAVVLDAADTQSKIGVLDGTIHKISLANMKWARYGLKSAKVLLKKGDVIIVEQVKDEYGLAQIPEVNGAMMVLEPGTGRVLATQGGYDFDASKFNRSTQALRQPGSLSKPFVYLAALENGTLPNQIFTDGPISISQGKGMPDWNPKNYKGDFLGDITMRAGLEKSRNLITVRVAQSVGINKVAELIKRFGINKEPRLFYSMVLGALETTLEKMTRAYGIIASDGKKIDTHFVEIIKDRNGKIIYQREVNKCLNCVVTNDMLDSAALPTVQEEEKRIITDEASNYQITSMLSGVVERGTAGRAKKLGIPIAGKTGTTNNSKDTWFIGFTPRIIVGTYVGYDTPKDMGTNATGSSIALPIFVDFMEGVYPKGLSLPFKVPDSIQLVSVDRATGQPSDGPGSIQEAFKVSNIEIERYKEGAEEVGDIFRDVPIIDHSQEIY
jgi:penicillin-binding protein 1A